MFSERKTLLSLLSFSTLWKGPVFVSPKSWLVPNKKEDLKGSKHKCYTSESLVPVITTVPCLVDTN